MSLVNRYAQLNQYTLNNKLNNVIMRLLIAISDVISLKDELQFDIIELIYDLHSLSEYTSIGKIAQGYIHV